MGDVVRRWAGKIIKEVSVGLSILLISVLVPQMALLAQAPEINSTSPAPNELNVSPSANISVTFDIDMDKTTINDSTFMVNATITGLHSGTITYDSLTQTANFDPDEDFDVGEVVTVVLTSGIQSSEGIPLNNDTSYSWSFTTGVNDGPGTFLTDAIYPVPSWPWSIVTADLDNDGDNDLAVAGYDNVVSILLNDGNATFTLDSSYQVAWRPYDMTAADLDGDGDIDLATSNECGEYIGWVSVILNNGDATFAPYTVYYVQSGTAYSICAADLDGDGDQDLASGTRGYVSVMMNDGYGAFAVDSTYPAGFAFSSICAADFDKDGDFDLATASEEVHVLMNNSDGTFVPDSVYPVGQSPYSVVAADLDGDGDVDIATANETSEYFAYVSVLLNNGDGTFAPYSTYGLGVCVQSICAGDFDGDGDLDLAAASGCGHSVWILMNNGDGTFPVSSNYPISTWPNSVCAADLDDDGDLDLASANLNSSDVWVLLNQEIYDFCGDVNADSLVDIADVVYLINYLFRSGPPPQCPPEPYTFCADCNGNGEVNIADVVYLVNYVLTSGPPPIC